MTDLPTTSLIVGILVLGAGTYAFRVAGPLLRAHVELTERPRTLMTTGAVVSLVALVATATLVESGGPAGVARPAGVLVGGVLAWRRAPFVAVVVAAAATAALLRRAGVP